jgi:putative transposase
MQRQKLCTVSGNFDILLAIMPSRNLVKQYAEGGYYHIYNRGVEKRTIFIDEQDYSVFLRFLRSYLTDETVFPNRTSPRVNLSAKVQIVAYCLMPNHYHLLIHQNVADGMTQLMRRALTGYSMYFNRRHGRVGPLFQAYFKAALIQTDEYLMHVSKYIHLNPSDPENYRFSSLRYYLDGAPDWIDPKPITSLFSSANAYLSFLRDKSLDPSVCLGELTLEPA